MEKLLTALQLGSVLSWGGGGGVGGGMQWKRHGVQLCRQLPEELEPWMRPKQILPH